MRYALVIVGLILALCPLNGAAAEPPPAAAWDPNELSGFVDGVMEA